MVSNKKNGTALISSKRIFHETTDNGHKIAVPISILRQYESSRHVLLHYMFMIDVNIANNEARSFYIDRLSRNKHVFFYVSPSIDMQIDLFEMRKLFVK